jgi:murein DD-endopeptidase MepM/ murein hydrolase activator NlpD
MKLANNKKDMLASIPAIQPISNKKLKMIASGFGHRIDPVYKTIKFHEGIDFTAAIGTPIYATGNGTVMSASMDKGGYGNCVVINHGFGYQSLYGHCSRLNVRPGQKVNRGDIIGFVGSTGKSTGPHVHYEVIKGGSKINPINFFYNDLNAAEYDEVLTISSQSNQSFD